MLQDIDTHTSIPAAGTGLFPGTGPRMLWDTDVTVRKIWVEISVPRLPLLQAEDFVSSLFATIVCSPGSHHHSLVCTGFSFCILIWKADWCTKGIDRICLLFCIFLLILEECPKYKTCLYFLLIFWLWNHFLQVPELKGWDRTSCSSLSEWIPVTWSESKTRTLLWKGKLICYLIVPSCSSWILQKLFFRAWEQTNC